MDSRVALSKTASSGKCNNRPGGFQDDDGAPGAAQWRRRPEIQDLRIYLLTGIRKNEESRMGNRAMRP
jgi:hypothetical protein